MIPVLLQLPSSLLIGFLTEAVTKVINLVFFFVPTRAGVFESGNALLLQALEMSAAAGLRLLYFESCERSCGLDTPRS